MGASHHMRGLEKIRIDVLRGSIASHHMRGLEIGQTDPDDIDPASHHMRGLENTIYTQPMT